MQQLTISETSVDQIDLVLAAWSEARPAASALAEQATTAERDPHAEHQLRLRLADTQLPLWDARGRR